MGVSRRLLSRNAPSDLVTVIVLMGSADNRATAHLATLLPLTCPSVDLRDGVFGRRFCLSTSRAMAAGKYHLEVMRLFWCLEASCMPLVPGQDFRLGMQGLSI